MPSTNELYDQLIRPKIQERLEHKMHLAKKREERKEDHRMPIRPDCSLYGHYPKGSWTIQRSPGGKTYAKCGRCNLGYLLPPLS